MTRFKKPEWILPAGTGIASLAVYLFTLAPGLTFIDAGELATVTSVLGIAHPTGYPLFTLIGWVFAHLPAGSEPIVRLNAMAAIFCAAGIALFTRLVLFLLTRGNTRQSREPLASSAGAGLLLAFSETYWSQATAIEVYSLHCFLLISVIYVFLLASDQRNAGDRRTAGEEQDAGREALWWLFAYLLGLSFTNHMTTILLAPAFFYYYFARQGADASSWKRVGFMSIPFLLGLSLYLYLPIRAAQNPPMNWGNPSTLEHLLWHFSGKQYQVWIFSSSSAAWKQLSYFLRNFPAEFAYAGGLLAAIGLPVLWRRDRRLFIFTALLFTGCIAYSINYDINDIDSYFLLAYITTAIWAGFGLLGIENLLARLPGKGWKGALLVASAVFPLVVNFPLVNERDNHFVGDYTRNMFASLQPGALVFSYQWENWVSAAFYEQLVLGVRTDLTVVDKELLRRSWYYVHLQKRHPELIQASRMEVEAFLRELEKFEHGRPYNSSVIEARYAAMIRSFIEKNLSLRPVYVTDEIEAQYTAGFQRAPEGMAMRLYPDTLFHPVAMPEFIVRGMERDGRLESQTRRLYAGAYLARGDYYLARRSDRAEARNCYEKALRFMPADPAILQRMSVAAK